MQRKIIQKDKGGNQVVSTWLLIHSRPGWSCYLMYADMTFKDVHLTTKYLYRM